MIAREQRITEIRQTQSMHELQRKAVKAISKSNLWTQEEIDYAHARALKWASFFNQEVK